MTPTQTQLDALDPLQRVEFDTRPIRRWQITWADGTTEVVEGHHCGYSGERRELMQFGWWYVGMFRTINLAHTRDVRELP